MFSVPLIPIITYKETFVNTIFEKIRSFSVSYDIS